MVDTTELESPTPTFPQIFDKSRIVSGEFDRYIYKIPFKIKGGGQKIAKGMTAAGNIHAIHPYLKQITSELLHYGTIGERKILCCVVRVTITIRVPPYGDKTVSALADGDLTGVPSADTLVRTTETRALNRAMERLLDIAKVDFNDPTLGIDEEESGTPFQAPNSNSLTAKMKAKKDKEEQERKKIREAEGEDDNQADERRVFDNEDDNAATAIAFIQKDRSDDW